MKDQSRALVVLSGGQDSTTCLFLAKAKHEHVEAVTFNYGQRHAIEIEAAKKIATMAGVTHHIIPVPHLMGNSPLTNKSVSVGHYNAVSEMPGGVEPTFVPGRNLIFLALAANVAAARECRYIYIGVGQEDFGGYPDCRARFVERMEWAINAALGEDDTPFLTRIMTPLMFLSKKQEVELALSLPGCMEALAFSHTCYDGQYPPNPKNHASILRARGFHEAGVADPLIVRAKSEGLLPADYPDDGYVVKKD